MLFLIFNFLLKKLKKHDCRFPLDSYLICPVLYLHAPLCSGKSTLNGVLNANLPFCFSPLLLLFPPTVPSSTNTGAAQDPGKPPPRLLSFSGPQPPTIFELLFHFNTCFLFHLVFLHCVSILQSFSQHLSSSHFDFCLPHPCELHTPFLPEPMLLPLMLMSSVAYWHSK